MKERKPYISSTMLPLRHQGKVRDIYNIPGYQDLMLIVSTDAVSTHNICHESMIPDKGYILNALSIFWESEVLSGIPTHLVAYGRRVYEYLPGKKGYPHDLLFRAVIVKKLDSLPIEFIWRSRLAGSLWKSYCKGEKNPYGHDLERGLQLMSEFAGPLFTPTEKSENDEPLNSQEVEERYPQAVAFTKKVYTKGRTYAHERGIDIIDTKMEIGIDNNGVVTLQDEWLTPDSSRFVRSKDIEVGISPPWMDKQVVREAAEGIWNGRAKYPIDFAGPIVKQAQEAFHRVFEQLTEKTLEQFLKNI